jgi:hypothetical protein
MWAQTLGDFRNGGNVHVLLLCGLIPSFLHTLFAPLMGLHLSQETTVVGATQCLGPTSHVL